jgi:hypothetical protein
MRLMRSVGVIGCLLMLSASAHGAQMFRFDVQSLAYMSSAVIEGDVTAYQDIHWVDKLTVIVTRVYAGDIKQGDAVTVGLSAYCKAGKDAFDFQRFGKGDHLILFIQPVTQESWKQDGIPYWPAPSGLKLVSEKRVTGVEQQENPGPYVNSIDEGNADKYREKLAEAVKWAAQFKRDLEANRQKVDWMLKQLKARPQIKPETWGVRDYIAVTLCQAIADTGDRAAIEQAKTIRTDRYERQVLDLPPEPKPQTQVEPQ